MKKQVLIASVIMTGLLALSCSKEGKDNGGTNQGGGTPAQLGVEVKDAQETYEVAQHENKVLSLSVVASPTSSESYTITLGTNPSLVAKYNEKNGTSYQMLPSDAYTLSASQLILPRYSPKSSACELRLKGEGCEQDKVYLLPVVIDAVQGGTNFSAPDDKAAYILFKMLAPAQQGSGTQADPYLVADVDGFMKIGSLLKDDATTYFKLSGDIDFSSVSFTEENPWTPINYAAADSDVEACEKRKIVLDGNNHKITGFKGGGALIAILRGSVRNLTIENAEVDCLMGNVGGILAGNAAPAVNPDDVVFSNITIKNSSLKNDHQRSGGLVAWLKGGKVENVEVQCKVEGGDAQAGGMIGRMEAGELVNCSASGNVEASKYYVGGLVGYMAQGIVKNCHASGNVASTVGNYARAGGLVGELQDATFENCYATGNVSGFGHYGGGLVGVINKSGKEGETTVYYPSTVTISKCYATGNVELPQGANWAHAGGLVGSVTNQATLNISNCYATGKIVCERYSSGFLGSCYGGQAAQAKVTVTNSYTTSEVSVNRLYGIAFGGTVGTVSYKGFIAWNPSKLPLCNPEDAISAEGNYNGSEGSVSAQAKTLGWSEDIWDLSKDLPTLK